MARPPSDGRVTSREKENSKSSRLPEQSSRLARTMLHSPTVNSFNSRPRVSCVNNLSGQNNQAAPQEKVEESLCTCGNIDPMRIAPYARVLRVPGVRALYWLALVARIPVTAAPIALTLRVALGLHGVQGEFFSNAFSNASKYVRSHPDAAEFKAQYSNRLRSPPDARELKSTASRARSHRSKCRKVRTRIR
jgi:hypothetical protein